MHRGQAFASLGALTVHSGSSIDLSRATSVTVAGDLSIDAGAWGNLSAITSVGGHMYFAGPELDDGAHNHVYPNVGTVTSVLFKSINSANGTAPPPATDPGVLPFRTFLTKHGAHGLWPPTRAANTDVKFGTVGTLTVSTPDTFSYTFSQLTEVATFTVTAGTFGGAYPVLTDVGTLDITTTGHDWPYDGGLAATFAALQTAPNLRVQQAKLRRSTFPGTTKHRTRTRARTGQPLTSALPLLSCRAGSRAALTSVSTLTLADISEISSDADNDALTVDTLKVQGRCGPTVAAGTHVRGEQFNAVPNADATHKGARPAAPEPTEGSYPWRVDWSKLLVEDLTGCEDLTFLATNETTVRSANGRAGICPAQPRSRPRPRSTRLASLVPC